MLRPNACRYGRAASACVRLCSSISLGSELSKELSIGGAIEECAEDLTRVLLLHFLPLLLGFAGP